MKSSSWIKLLSFTITLAAGAAIFVWFLDRYDTEDTFAILNDFGLFAFFGFVAISLANFSLLGWRWQMAVNEHALERKLSFWTVVRHRMSGYAVSYLTPSAQVGGEPLRIALLHKDGVPIAHATSSVILDVVFEIAGFIIYIALGLFISLFQNVLPTRVEWAVGSALAVIACAIVLFFLSITSSRGFFSTGMRLLLPRRFALARKLEPKLLRVESLMRETLRRNPHLILWMLGISIITVAFRGVEVAYLAYFLGHPVGVVEAILLSSIPGLALLVPIPSALGVLEGSTAGIVALLGLALNPIALVLLIRFRDVIFIILGVAHIGHSLQTWLQKKIVEPVSIAVHRL